MLARARESPSILETVWRRALSATGAEGRDRPPIRNFESVGSLAQPEVLIRVFAPIWTPPVKQRSRDRCLTGGVQIGAEIRAGSCRILVFVHAPSRKSRSAVQLRIPRSGQANSLSM